MALLLCFCFSGLVNVFAVVTVPVSTYLGMPSFGSYLNFDAEQNFTSLYRESSANVSYPEYWFMTLLSGETFGLQGDANFTVSTVFANQSLVYTQLTSGSVHVYCGNLGEPTSVSGVLSSSYDAALNVSSLFSIGSSTVRVSWATVPPPPPPDVTLSINQPTATSYNTSEILTSLSASGGTIDKIWFNVQNSSGAWVYVSSQFYTAPYFMTGFTNDSYVLYAFANNTVGNSDVASVSFSVAIPSVPPIVTEPVLSVIQPFNKTYATGNVPVELSTSGTVDAVWFNIKNGSAWIYTVNQTYTAATSLTGFVNGSYVFYGFAANSEGGFDMKTVSFSVAILANPLLPQVDLDSLWLFLYEGDFLGFLQAYLISVFLNFETAVALIIFLFLVPIYLRTKSLLLVSILWMMLGGFFVAAVPAAAGIGVLFIALGIGGLLWRLFRPSGYG